MFVFDSFIGALIKVIMLILDVMSFFIFFRAVISWVSPDPYNPIVQFLYRVTEPILQPFRNLLPRMGVDISPMIAILVIVFFREFLIGILRGI